MTNDEAKKKGLTTGLYDNIYRDKWGKEDKDMWDRKLVRTPTGPKRV